MNGGQLQATGCDSAPQTIRVFAAEITDQVSRLNRGLEALADVMTNSGLLGPKVESINKEVACDQPRDSALFSVLRDAEIDLRKSCNHLEELGATLERELL